MRPRAGELRSCPAQGATERDRALAFNTVQTVMENLYRKGWLGRRKDGRAYWYESVRSRDDYADGLLAGALSVAGSWAGAGLILAVPCAQFSIDPAMMPACLSVLRAQSRCRAARRGER